MSADVRTVYSHMIKQQDIIFGLQNILFERLFGESIKCD